MKSSMKPYAVEWLRIGCGPEIAKVEFPFLIQSAHENEADFEVRAQRDFELILRFALKFVTRKAESAAVAIELGEPAENAPSPVVAKDIGDMLKLHITTDGIAVARAFVNGIGRDLCEPVLDLFYDEFTGNLPAWFMDMRPADVSIEKSAPVRKKPKLVPPVAAVHQPLPLTRPLAFAVPNP